VNLDQVERDRIMLVSKLEAINTLMIELQVQAELARAARFQQDRLASVRDDIVALREMFQHTEELGHGPS
jgi:hypothetical protein